MLKKIKIESTASTFHMPKEGEIVRQTLIISQNGKCSIAVSEWTKDMKIRRVGTEKFTVEESIAKEVLDIIESINYEQLYMYAMMDAGEFTITLYTTDNAEKTYESTALDIE